MSEFEEDVEAFLRYYREVVRLRGVEHALREAVEDCVRVRHRYADCLHRVQEVEAERDSLRARITSLEAEVERHRERANVAELAWEGHQASDCAIKCAREIESLLGTSDPVEAARAIKALQGERDSLRARLADVEAQAAVMRSALEDVDAMHRSALGQANERGDNLTPLELFQRVRNALSSSVGRETAERLRLLEELLDLAAAFTENCTVAECFNRLDVTNPNICYDACLRKRLRIAVRKLKGGTADAGTEA